MPIIILAVAFIIINTIYVKYYKIIRNFKYKLDIKKENVEFNREINVDYSPSIVSYLYNQKIELEKDLISDILNLYARKIIDIRLKEDNTYEIIMDRDKYEDLYWKNKLLENDRYILHTIVQKRFNFKYEEWQTKIKNVYRKHLMNNEEDKTNKHKNDSDMSYYIKMSIIIFFITIILKLLLRNRFFRKFINIYYIGSYNVNFYSINRKDIK